MTGQRAAVEPYTTRFQTEVTAVDGRSVWLETTYFYAESGGQPADRGRIGDVPVEGVQLVDGEHVHVLAEEPSFGAGGSVMCSIDWTFRMYCMRAHTASHALYGAGRRLFDDLGYGGFDIGDEKVRVDFETSTEIDDERLVELDELVNRSVWESRPVSWEEIPAAEARDREGIAFNEATEEAFRKGQVRVVTIGAEDDDERSTNGSSDPWDVAACGGTHVRNTREIGPVTVLGRSNPGEGLTRVEFAVGPRAIERRTVEKRTTLASKRELGVGIENVPDALEGLRAERDSLAERRRVLERDLVAAHLAAGEPIERGDTAWLVTAVEDVSGDAVGEVLRDRTEEFADVVVAVGDGDSPFVAVGATGDERAAAIVDEVTDEFGGGGGGSDRFAQGGGFDAEVDDIVDWLG